MGDKQRELFKNQLRFLPFSSPFLLSFPSSHPPPPPPPPFNRYIDQHCLVAASEAGDPHSPNPPPPAPTSFDSSKLPSDTWNLVSVRRETVKAFLKASPSKACACCNTQSPSFKKNRDSKIFEKVFFFFILFCFIWGAHLILFSRFQPKGRPRPKKPKKC